MGRLRQTAAQQAAAEYGPQKAGVRRSVRQQKRSIRSTQPALEASIQTAENQLRHAGLRGHDLQMALAELARRNVDVGSSTALQLGQVSRTGAEELADLTTAQGQSQRSILSQLQTAAQEHQQDIADEQRGVGTAIEQKILEQKLGLSGEGSDGGLTSTQQRAQHHEHENAAFYAKQLVQAVKDGYKDEKTGKWLIPPGPHKWDDSIWNGLVEKVVSKDGVDNVQQAQRAVQAVRDHYQPPAAHSAGGILGSLFKMAAIPAAAGIGTDALQPVAQAALRQR